MMTYTMYETYSEVVYYSLLISVLYSAYSCITITVDIFTELFTRIDSLEKELDRMKRDFVTEVFLSTNLSESPALKCFDSEACIKNTTSEVAYVRRRN